jgi:hypothetical protein
MKMQLPNEIINVILSYMERPFHNKIMEKLIDDYENDYNPLYAEDWYDNYCFTFTLKEEQFHYLKKLILCKSI